MDRYNAEYRAKRITPAHAGKSALVVVALSVERDHPRTRGEKSDDIAMKLSNMGSPPHTRGKERSSSSIVTEYGITPAHAGKRLKNPVKSPFIMLF